MAGTVLYEADWSDGPDGWPEAFGWSWLDGMLVNDGSISSATFIRPAYSPEDKGVRDVAVEAEIRSLAGQTCFSFSNRAFHLQARSYYATIGRAGCVEIDPTEAYLTAPGASRGSVADLRSLASDNEWHTYRIEVQGNDLTLLMDGVVVLEGEDNEFLSPGLIGLASTSDQLEVRSFKVIAL